ncbi:hypothetical protein ACJMK2_038598 [Sinanodonta woodiana]|uniref:SHSP domain-containing protein n=1 Tax=Sinanodonta woodiana TaxID=1069815 RepID=A0ABD3W9G7_SINWO
MSMIPRTIPIYKEADLWRRSSEFSPSFSSSYSSPFRSSSLVHYPGRDRQNYMLDSEMRRMHDEMNKMLQNTQKFGNPGTVDDWKLTENFGLEKPIITERDGSRKFRLEFDMRQFKPDEISVRTVGNQLSVHAKHEEKDGGKVSSSEFKRQYVIPREVDPERLISKLSASGVLSIEARLPALDAPRDRLIFIDHRK